MRPKLKVHLWFGFGFLSTISVSKVMECPERGTRFIMTAGEVIVTVYFGNCSFMFLIIYSNGIAPNLTKPGLFLMLQIQHYRSLYESRCQQKVFHTCSQNFQVLHSQKPNFFKFITEYFMQNFLTCL
jgi:hypothetical protein